MHTHILSRRRFLQHAVSATAALTAASWSRTYGANEQLRLASVGVASPAAQEVDEQTCFDEDKAPLAIASAQGLVVIQLGNDLKVSRNDAVDFETVGEPSAVADTAAATY